MTNGIDFSIDRSGVANLIFDLPNEKINKLSKNVLEELLQEKGYDLSESSPYKIKVQIVGKKYI